MTFQDIINEVESSSWQPEFEWVSTIREVSERINAPHEDYPLGVQPTIQMLGLLTDEKTLSWADACNIQKFLFIDKQDQIRNSSGKLSHLPNQFINLGLRRTEVKVGNWKPPHPMFLPDLIQKIFSIRTYQNQTVQFHIPGFPTGAISAFFWYKLFQTIHPFEDLNGRVGGIILTALTHSNGQFLAPKRFVR